MHIIGLSVAMLCTVYIGTHASHLLWPSWSGLLSWRVNMWPYKNIMESLVPVECTMATWALSTRNCFNCSHSWYGVSSAWWCDYGHLMITCDVISPPNSTWTSSLPTLHLTLSSHPPLLCWPKVKEYTSKKSSEKAKNLARRLFKG